jgi:hypothetical protein
MSSEINCADLQNRCLGQECGWRVIQAQVAQWRMIYQFDTAAASASDLFRFLDMRAIAVRADFHANKDTPQVH